MTPTADRLLELCDTLQKTVSEELAGQEQQWATRVSSALGHVERSLRQHTADAESPTGLFATEVDLTRPTLVRKVGKLRRDHEEFSERAKTLRKEVDSTAEAFARPRSLPTAGDLPAAAPSGGLADFSTVRQSLEAFLAALRQHREQEAGIAIESVTTDLGAGD